MASEADVQNWINKHWGKGSYDPTSDYHNIEALLAKLQHWEQRERGKGSEAYALIAALYERVQFMRELALNEKAV